MDLLSGNDSKPISIPCRMTRAVIHIGLHKTGTTSFQEVCARSQDILAERGVLYPLNYPLTLGTAQHQGLVASLRFGDFSRISTHIQMLAEISTGFETLLLSSEEFSFLFGSLDCQLAGEATHNTLKSVFSDVRYVCTIREDKVILRSMLREMIEGVGMPYNGANFVTLEVSEFYKRNRRLSHLLTGNLTVLRYEHLVPNILVNELMRQSVGIDLGFFDMILHSSSNKGVRQLISGPVRMLLFNAYQAETPYTADLNRLYEGFLNGIRIEPDVESELQKIFLNWLEKQIDDAISTERSSLEEIYFSEVRNIRRRKLKYKPKKSL
jgi:hypothetical protein